ncbi:MAG TPA: MFS transporter [Gaiella sp.]|uniref:MFS transporter n=1 Tax=Gaiella sp. TaxID=2663207 RepID=UPI002D7FA619|nr:MFS transporter [Gaiella sp.]HET9287393.1 MFS transporter [Gaiella sp.]
MRARLVTEENKKWWTLAAVSFGLFMIMLDNTVVNVALPAIQRDLGVGLSELEWIVSGYALTFAALMLVGGKLADAYGRRLLFVIGIAVFTLASLACGLATSGDMLIAARIAQGAGAAMMNPATLSIIAATFPARQRGTAIGIWAGVSALALAIGPLVGGLLTDHASWHWIFFVNVPVGILGIAASFLLIDESHDPTHERLDLPGLATSAIGLFALTYGLIEANTYGWGSPRIVGAFAIAAAGLLAFLFLERHQRAPMLDLTLFRNRTYVGANLVVLLVALAMFGVFFFVSLYMQNVLGFTAVQAGAAFLPMTILVIVVAPIAGRVSDRFGSRGLMTAGMALLSVQLVYFSQLGTDETFWTLLPGLVLGGVGLSLTMTPSAAAATRAVPVEKAGVGAAVLNAFRQVGGSVGIALMGAIMAAQLSEPPSIASFMRGFEHALLVAAGIAIAGAIVAGALIRPHDTTRETGEQVQPAEAA